MTQSPAKKSFFNRNVDLMNGPIFKSLFIFMLPILVSCLFQQLYNTVDTMIVGNVLGDTALAAIGACGAIYELLVGFGIGIGNGLAIVAARAYGAGDDDQLKQTVAGSIASASSRRQSSRWRVRWACIRCWNCWTPRRKF